MKSNYRKSLLESMLAFIVGTSCCWLSSLVIWLGGATFLTILSSWVNTYNLIILGIAFLFLMMAIFQFWKYTSNKP